MSRTVLRQWAAWWWAMAPALVSAQVEPVPSPAPAASAPLQAPAATAATTAAPTPLPQLRIEAPSDLRALLERHLDLARAISDQQAARDAARPTPDKGSARAADAPAADIGSVEWSRLIAGAPAQARTLLQTEGYFAALAYVEREDTQVRLVVRPGPIARVDKLVIDIQGELADALSNRDGAARRVHGDLMAQWPLQQGAAFSNPAWSSAKNTAIARLRAEGYAAATWSGTSAEVITGEQPSVNIFAVVDSGPLFRTAATDAIEVQGMVHHDEGRVRALAGLSPGDPLTEARLLDYQERLLRTGLYDQATVSLDPEAAQTGQSRVLVKIKEAPLQNATIGLGYGTNTGPRTTLEHTHRRLADRDLVARNKLELGRDRRAWDGELSTHPNALMQRYLLGGTYELLKTSEDRTISQRARLGRSEDLPGLERLAYAEFERSNECTYAEGRCLDPFTIKAVSANLHHTWRRLDNAVLPTRGHALNLQAGAGWATGDAKERPASDQPASGPFTRLYARLTAYRPLPAGFFSEGRIELGGVLAKNGVVVPDSQRFRAGGDGSVRGYDYRTLAPSTPEGGITGGKMLATASVELARPVSSSLPSVWWATFVDAGRAADRVKDLDPALGYGVGARWRSPVGPLKLDLAYGQEEKQWRVHLSVGIAF
jgi:translocation and assembly module TamA